MKKLLTFVITFACFTQFSFAQTAPVVDYPAERIAFMDYYLKEVNSNDNFLKKTTSLFTPAVRISSGTVSTGVGIYLAAIVSAIYNTGNRPATSTAKATITMKLGPVILIGLSSLVTGISDSVTNSTGSKKSVVIIPSNKNESIDILVATLSKMLDLNSSEKLKLERSMMDSVNDQVISGADEIMINISEVVESAGIISESEEEALKNLLADIEMINNQLDKVEVEDFSTIEALTVLSIDLENQIQEESKGDIKSKLVKMLKDVEERIELYNYINE